MNLNYQFKDFPKHLSIPENLMNEKVTSLPKLFYNVLKNENNEKFLNTKENDLKWNSISTKSFFEKVKNLVYFLKKQGIKKGDFVGIVSPSTPQWVIFDLALSSLGATSIPMFDNLSEQNIDYQIKNVNLQFIFLSGNTAYLAISPFFKSFKWVILENCQEHSEKKSQNTLQFYSLEEIIMKQAPVEFDEEYEEIINSIQEDDLVSIIYTSGSTGIPKGVMLSNKNFLNQLKHSTGYYALDSKKDQVVSCLPLAHIFERILLYTYLIHNVSIHFCPKIDQVGNIIREIQPTCMAMVPRLLDKVHEKIIVASNELPMLKKLLAKKALQRAENKYPGDKIKIQDIIFQELIYKKFYQALGGNFKMVIVGGATLSKKTYNFFSNIGLNIYEGYGLTETSPVIASNHSKNRKHYTVGKPFGDTKIKIAENGEILVKSPSVTQGYYKKKKTTMEIFDEDEWFKTGDKGHLDNDGFLVFDSRIKELYKTSNGKFVSPIAIEDVFNKSNFIDYTLVIAEDKRFTSAIFFINMEYKEEENNSLFLKKIDKLVNRTNKDLNHWEKIKKYSLVWKKLTIKEQEITPKMNIRRNFLMEKYKEKIDKMYL